MYTRTTIPSRARSAETVYKNTFIRCTQKPSHTEDTITRFAIKSWKTKTKNENCDLAPTRAVMKRTPGEHKEFLNKKVFFAKYLSFCKRCDLLPIISDFHRTILKNHVKILTRIILNAIHLWRNIAFVKYTYHIKV